MRDTPSAADRPAAPSENGVLPHRITSIQQAFDILDCLDEAFFAMDATWRFTYINQEAARIAGRPREGLIGRRLPDLYPELMDTPLVRYFARAMDEQTPIHFDTITADHRWYEVHLYPAPDGLFVHCCEITERKRVEESLRQSEMRYRRLIETCYEGVWTIDAEGRTDFVNPRAAEMLGCRPEEMLGASPLDYVPAEDADLAFACIEGHRQGDHVQRVVRMRRKDGTDIYTRLLTTPIFSESGQYAGALAMFTDITEQRRAEMEREVLLRQLITAHEDERRLLALDLHDQTGQDLTALSLGLKGLEDRVHTDPSTLKRLRQLQSISNNLSREVRRIASALRPAMLDDLGLKQALRSYVEEWATQFGIAVDLHVSGLDGERLASLLEITIYRVVQEALTNIARHAGARRMTLLLERRKHLVQCIVEDDGVGFDVESFFASARCGSRRGLLGARERAALIGGTLTVESSPGQGTTVFLRFPLPTETPEGRHG